MSRRGAIKRGKKKMPAEHSLTERQAAILQMIAKGRTTARIAQELGISTNTVRSHVRMILATLDAKDRAHAVAIAMREGLIDGGA